MKQFSTALLCAVLAAIFAAGNALSVMSYNIRTGRGMDKFATPTVSFQFPGVSCIHNIFYVCVVLTTVC